MINTSNKDVSKIDEWQNGMQNNFKSTPDSGKLIKYLDKEFLVYPNTFWPFMDSQPLVKNFQIKEGESVLDVGTGSGVIAIFACYLGAGKVLAVDVNPFAIKSATYNAKLHGFDKIMTVVKSNLFEELAPEKFDVITANLPFRKKTANDVVASSQWDTDFATNKQFFKQVDDYLKPHGRIYFSQSNFGEVEEFKKIAKLSGFSVEQIGSHKEGEEKEFYAYVLKRLQPVEST